LSKCSTCISFHNHVVLFRQLQIPSSGGIICNPRVQRRQTHMPSPFPCPLWSQRYPTRVPPTPSICPHYPASSPSLPLHNGTSTTATSRCTTRAEAQSHVVLASLISILYHYHMLLSLRAIPRTAVAWSLLRSKVTLCLVLRLVLLLLTRLALIYGLRFLVDTARTFPRTLWRISPGCLIWIGMEAGLLRLLVLIVVVLV